MNKFHLLLFLVSESKPHRFFTPVQGILDCALRLLGNSFIYLYYAEALNMFGSAILQPEIGDFPACLACSLVCYQSVQIGAQ